jgi:hypothetical protein
MMMALPLLNSLFKVGVAQGDEVLAISIGSQAVEGVLYSQASGYVLRSVMHRLPPGIMTSSGDMISDTAALAECFSRIVADLRPHTRQLLLSIPCTLIRVVELPKMEDEEYYISLASEAERFRAFDNTEAIVQYERLPNASSPLNQRLVYTAIRKDTFLQYLRAAKLARLKLRTLSVEPMNIVRTLTTETFIHTVAPAGENAPAPSCWGTMMHDFDRLRFMVWHGANLVDIREITMSGQLLAGSEQDDLILNDLVTELRRTINTVKPLTPQFWYTHRLSFVLLQHLQHQLGVTFRSFQLPDNLNADRADMELSALGCALSVSNPLPYTLNILETKSPFQVEYNWQDAFSLSAFKGQASSFRPGGGEDQAAIASLLPVLVGSTVTVAVVWMFLLVGNIYLKNLQKQLLVTQEQVAANVERLNTQLEFHKQNYMLSQKIFSVADASNEVNQTLMGLLDDIRYLPPSVWISEIGYDEKVTIAGYALKHSDIITATREFETRPYGKDFILHYITEAIVGADSPSVYSFMLGGMLSTTSQAPSTFGSGIPTAEATPASEPLGQPSTSPVMNSATASPANTGEDVPPVSSNMTTFSTEAKP